MRTSKSYKKYMKLFGPHFNKKLCNFAVSLMSKGEGPIKAFTKEEIDEKLNAQNAKLEYNELHDYVYVANMCKADFLGQSVPDDDYHLCLYIKNVIDDSDGYDGQVFYRWLSDVEGMNIHVDWEEFV